jgi:hypothetical protein
MKYAVATILALGLVQPAGAQVDIQADIIRGDGRAPIGGPAFASDPWLARTDFATMSRTASLSNQSFAAVADQGPVEPGSAQSGATVGELSPRVGEATAALGGELSAQMVPEPATWLMMLAGLGAIGLVVHRRRREM